MTAVEPGSLVELHACLCSTRLLQTYCAIHAPLLLPLSVCLQLMADVARARAELQQPRLKLMALTAVQLRAVAKAVLMAPFTVPAALAARWQALFASNSYQNFLMSEGEQIWAWRNRTENERWFWEVFALDRWACCWSWGSYDDLSEQFGSSGNAIQSQLGGLGHCIAIPFQWDGSILHHLHP